MRRPAKLALLAVVLLGLLGLLLFWGVVRRGLSTHDKPSRVEAWAARAARHWATPADLRDTSNPLPPSPQVLADAQAHWADHCASCHGNDGRGQTELGKRMYPPAPDMTLAATQSLSDGELFAVIENGIRLTGMPGWGDGTAESGYGSWGLVHFVRHLPKLTREEIAAMEALNPKTPEEWEEIQAEEAFLTGEPEPEGPTSNTGGHSAAHPH